MLRGCYEETAAVEFSLKQVHGCLSAVDGSRSGVVQELSADGVRTLATGDRRDHV